MRTGLDDAATLSPPPSAANGQSDQGEQLLVAVDEIAATLAGEAAQGEADGQLTQRAVDALRSRGLWRMRLCRELGGLELPIVTQLRVLSALAAVDTSSAWCTMVANSSVAVLGGSMPSPATDIIFADGVPTCSIVAAPGGKATPVDGGYQISGTWRLASGIHHTDWIHAAAFINGDPSQLLPLALPTRDVQILDSWHVVGLAGTGSNDFTVSDYFLPASLAGRTEKPYGQLRGERRYDTMGLDHLESYEHLAFAIGVARRALDELTRSLAGDPSRRTVSDREVVQSQIGEAVVKLRAIEALAVTIYARVDAASLGQTQLWTKEDRHLPRALAVWATEAALDVTQLAFQRSGAGALLGPNILEKLLRDMSVAATHIMVDDRAVAGYAQHLLESRSTDSDLRTRSDAR